MLLQAILRGTSMWGSNFMAIHPIDLISLVQSGGPSNAATQSHTTPKNKSSLKKIYNTTHPFVFPVSQILLHNIQPLHKCTHRRVTLTVIIPISLSSINTPDQSHPGRAPLSAASPGSSLCLFPNGSGKDRLLLNAFSSCSGSLQANSSLSQLH